MGNKVKYFYIMKKYSHVVLGGTFDHFHNGHKALIDKAFSIGEKVTIGIAKKNLYKNKLLAESIEPFAIRHTAVSNYLQENKLSEQAKLVPINNIFGPSITDKTFDAIIASKQTYQNTLLVNQKRSRVNLPLLKIITVDDVFRATEEILSGTH